MEYRNTRRHLTHSEIDEAIGMLRSERSQTDVARYFNVNCSVICRLWRRQCVTGSPYVQRPGRVRLTTPSQDRYILLQTRREPTLTARQLQSRLSTAENILVSDQTIRNRLHEHGLNARRPLRCPPIRFVVPEPVKKVARGGKKRGTQESSADVDEEITEPPKKASKGAKKSTVEENGDSKEKTENTKKANGRGKRGATPAVEEAADPIKKAQGGKSKKPLAEETIEEEDEEQVEEEEPAVEEPAKKSSGRGSKKAKDSTAKDTASTKKGSTGGRGRKRAGSAKKEQDITEEAEDEEDAGK